MEVEYALVQNSLVTTWSEIDEPVLCWLLERDVDPEWKGSIQLTLRPQPEAVVELGGLDTAQIDAALLRLQDHMLIAGHRSEAIGYSRWSRLRLRAEGLILLGEWPDLDRIASATGLQALLAALAEQAEDAGQQGDLRRTVGAIGRLGEAIVEDTMASVAADAIGST